MKQKSCGSGPVGREKENAGNPVVIRFEVEGKPPPSGNLTFVSNRVVHGPHDARLRNKFL
jgi:hypothetical protein